MAIFGVLTPFSGHQIFPINIIDIVATADAQRLRLTATASACGQWSNDWPHRFGQKKKKRKRRIIGKIEQKTQFSRKTSEIKRAREKKIEEPPTLFFHLTKKERVAG